MSSASGRQEGASRGRVSRAVSLCLRLAFVAAEISAVAVAAAQAADTTDAFAWRSPTLLGDMGGLRPRLARYGVTLQLFEEAETFGNLTGGVRQGFEVNGVTTAQLQWDPKPLLGIDGGLFNASGFHIWGGALSATNLLNLQTVGSLEANASIRLWELWWQQKFGDRLDVRIGEQSLDEEFMISQNSAIFLNGVMGWPMLPSANLPAGGPAYPLAGLGVRGRFRPSDAITLMAGVFNGSPIPLNAPNTPLSNPNGVSFPLDTGVLAVGELQFAYPALDPWGTSGPLPGTVKIGAWYDSEAFDSQQADNGGLPLASPESKGIPGRKQGNYSVYAIVDQTVWRAATGRAFNAFLRPMFTTLQDRNLIGFSVNGGLTLTDPLPGRDHDVFGLGFGVAKVSGGASNADRLREVFEPKVATPARCVETFLEATYQAQIAPSLQLQPDIQYIVNPGAGLANPDAPGHGIRDELVIGLRANVTF